MMTARPVAVAVAAAAPLLAAAPPAAAAPLAERLDRLVARSPYAAGTGVAVVDAASGRPVYLHRPDRPRRPGSTVKLATTAGLLARLGPAHRLTTRAAARGRRDGRVLRGDLWLVGAGDPSLATAPYARAAALGPATELRALAEAVRRRGIGRVAGDVVGDAGAADRRRTAPGWWPVDRLYCAPLSGLSVDEAQRVAGGIGVDRPALHAAGRFRAALRAAGVRVDGHARTGRAPRRARTVAAARSPRLDRLVTSMNHRSDNFYAEMLLKDLGRSTRGGRAGTTAAGVHAVRRTLRRLDVRMAGVRLVDGSGLSRRDRLTPRALAGLLVAVRDRPWGAAFRRSLPTAGVEGTLRGRMQGTSAYGRAVAKTGTLRDTSSLAGYVRARGGACLAFAIIVEGRQRRWMDQWAAHAVEDRIVGALAAAPIRPRPARGSRPHPAPARPALPPWRASFQQLRLR